MTSECGCSDVPYPPARARTRRPWSSTFSAPCRPAAAATFTSPTTAVVCGLSTGPHHALAHRERVGIRTRIGTLRSPSSVPQTPIRPSAHPVQPSGGVQLQIAHESARLLKLPKDDLRDLMFVGRELAYELLWRFVRTLSTRLRESNDRLLMLTVSSKF